MLAVITAGEGLSLCVDFAIALFSLIHARLGDALER